MDAILKFLNDNKDALGWLFGSGVVVAIIKLIQWFFKESRLRKTRSDENFPFKIIPPNSNIAKEIFGKKDNDLLADRNIPYQQRVASRNMCREIESELGQSRWVLITGKTGLGKTREAVYVAERLNKKGWTILHLTRDNWLSAPAKLPIGVPERKVLFILDDLNRKIYASRVEQSPRAKDNFLQPLNVPLQTRLHETLEVFEKLCGKNEIMVIATVRNETVSEFSDEPSEWDKLEFNKYIGFWKKFVIFSLPEADDEAEINLLASTVRKANIKANSDEFSSIARRNDGTFSNLVENLRTAKNENISLKGNSFRDTLKGSWDYRYRLSVGQYPQSDAIYLAVFLLREFRLPIQVHLVTSLACKILQDGFFCPITMYFKINKAVDLLIQHENILTPRDGQLEACPMVLEIDSNNYVIKILEVLMFPGVFYAEDLEIPLSNFIFWILSTQAKKSISKENNTIRAYSILCLSLHFPFETIALHLYSKGHLKTAFYILNSNKSFSKSVFSVGLLSVLHSQKGRQDKAISLLENAIVSAHPNSTLLYNELGHKYEEVGDFYKSEHAYKKAIELNPLESMAHSSLGSLLADKLHRYKEAEFYYRKAIELTPDYGTAYNNLGILLKTLERYDEAEDVYRKAIKLSPMEAASYSNLGNLLTENLNRYEEAEAAYRTAIDLDPNYSAAHHNFGILLAILERYDEAESAYRKAIKLDPIESEAYLALGNLLADKLNRYEEAETAYRKAIELNPIDYKAYTNLGLLLYEKLERYQEAIDTFHKSIELNPKNSKAFYNLGNLLSDKKIKRYEEAETAYRKAIELNPAYFNVYNNLGLLLKTLNRYEEAEFYYRKATELDSVASIYGNLGDLLKEMKRYDEAILAYQKATELDPQSIRFWNPLGIIYTLQKDYEKALFVYKKAIEIEPAKGTYYSSLVGILRRLGRETEAQAEMEIARKLIDKENEYDRACFESICGNTDEALRLLTIALEDKDESLDWARQDPDFDNLRDDPRFKELFGLE
jgi:tetratricopeptide (TPR) repeat protein